MGNSASGAAAESHDDVDRFDGIETLGYRVLGVQPNSPASQAGLVSFLDFIVGAEGKPLFDTGEHLEDGEEYDDIDFPSLLQEFKGRELELVVWNIKSQQQRWVTIVPDDSWGGAGLLGVTIRLDNYSQAEERLIHVLHMEHHSPAQIAGLVEYQDYLLGTTTETLDSVETLSKILQSHMDRVVELYVYNCESDMVRVVALMPTWSWGGKGLLGAQVATGYLHRLPSSTQETCGSSLERKVRWVGLAGNATNQSQPQQQQQQQQQQKQQSTNTTAKASVPTMEPQLEMEPADELERKGTNATQPNDEVQQNGRTFAPIRDITNNVAVTEEPRRRQRSHSTDSFLDDSDDDDDVAGTNAVTTVKTLVSSDTSAAVGATAAAITPITIAVSPSTAPACVPASSLSPLSSPAEEFFMKPRPTTPPNERTARRIQQPVKDPSIQVFVPPPMMSSPYWTQVASKKIPAHSPLPNHRSRAFSSDSLSRRTGVPIERLQVEDGVAFVGKDMLDACLQLAMSGDHNESNLPAMMFCVYIALPTVKLPWTSTQKLAYF